MTARTDFEASITLNELRERYIYNPATGVFTWAKSLANQAISAGDVAGCTQAKGYRLLRVRGRQIFAHRVAWFMTHGAWPVDKIDHINGDKADNRIANLREADHFGNTRNRGKYQNNTTGYKGVSRIVQRKNGREYNYFIAQISNGPRRRRIGQFTTAEAAYEAYCQEARKIHGEFANVG